MDGRLMPITTASAHCVAAVANNVGIAQKIVSVITWHGIGAHSYRQTRACGIRSTPGCAISVTVVDVVFVDRYLTLAERPAGEPHQQQ